MTTSSLINQEQKEFSLLYHLYESFQIEGDIDNQQKIIQLVNKLKENEYSIGFCGHFSAGKSSMMNELMGENILPSSPIPTSANLVKVKKGRPYARIFYKKEEPVEFPEPYDYEVVKGYCKDGDAIESIEISKDNIQLPEGIAVLDTPGIDSTDEAHLLATESALHLADIIFYVMDYNHVQSEQNFMFTKSLKEKGKPVYLIINQIDKHDESELDFAKFQESTEESFKSWGVNVDGIFYTSLKKSDHPHNQYRQLENFLYQKIDRKEELLLESVRKSAIQLIDEHVKYKHEQVKDEKRKLESQISNLSEEERHEAVEGYKSLMKEKNEIPKKADEFEKDFEARLKKLLDSAYLMPAGTRELARSFLESEQSDFKVGLLFAKKKTEEERRNRLLAFYEDFKKQVETQLGWHVKDLLTKILKEYDVNQDEVMQQVYELSVTFDEDLLLSVVKKGAGMTGDYILNYTKDVSEEIKRLYRNKARDILRSALEIMENEADEKLQVVERQLEEYESIKNVLEKVHLIDEAIDQHRQKLEKLTNEISELPTEKVLTWVENVGGEKTEIKQQVMYLSAKENEENEQEQEIVGKDENKNKVEQNQVNYQERIKQTVNKLKEAQKLVTNIKGVQSIARDMRQKADRLDNNQFTVALFGAFSAGKSSFANALIGEKVLPVSPNPTTATINKIMAPNEDHKHGTVKVILKTTDQLLKDISGSLKVFELSCSSIEEGINLIDSLDYDGKDPKVKTHYGFLQAAKLGYQDSKDYLDKSIYVGLDEFQEYVANEQKACFVESIELYYDCALTRQGVTLVDTPGADSINARHTGVAFEYIKNADAILFVTYYNHAFSKADREFLIQLGRVKETFELDKMFFIVNAADLAKDEEELNAVKDYVGEQLVQYGIRFPKIHSLSSKMALQEKVNQVPFDNAASGIYQFEQDFEAFMMGDLMEMTIQSAHEDLKYTVSVLDEIIDNAKQGDEVKKEKLISAKDTKARLKEKVTNLETYTEQKATEQEINELIHYVKQRVMLRSDDFFNEAFNPATLQDDGRNMKKAIQTCLNELIEAIGFDLSQEMRATSLRVEKFINAKLTELIGKVNKLSQQYNPNIHYIGFEERTLPSLDFKSPEEDFDRSRFASAVSSFKNPKDFFEKGGKAKMKEDLHNLLQLPVDEFLQTELARFQDHYAIVLSEEINKEIQSVLVEIDEFYEGIFAALSETIDIPYIEDTRKQVNSLI